MVYLVSFSNVCNFCLVGWIQSWEGLARNGVHKLIVNE